MVSSTFSGVCRAGEGPLCVHPSLPPRSNFRRFTPVVSHRVPIFQVNLMILKPWKCLPPNRLWKPSTGLSAEQTVSKSTAIKPRGRPHSRVWKETDALLSAAWVSGLFQPREGKQEEEREQGEDRLEFGKGWTLRLRGAGCSPISSSYRVFPVSEPAGPCERGQTAPPAMGFG